MDMLAGYTLLGRLGSGTSGTVWKAHDDTLDRFVAIKELRAPTAESRAQWRSEAHVLAALDDPHLVAIYGYAENADGAYIIEQWIDGAPLPGVLAAGPLNTGQALGVIRGALLGLAHVHSRGLVHGDIAPANILLDTDGTSKLVDFGLSTHAGAASSSSGTAAYASPEAQRGYPVTPPSDVYAVAAVLAYLLRGRATPDPVLDGLDPALHPVLRRALDPDPARRYPDAAAFLAALEADATRRYGPSWWTQAGLAALVAAAPAIALIEGGGASAAVAGHGAAAPHTITEHLAQPAHQAAFGAASPTGAVPEIAPPSPPPPDSAAANWRTHRPRFARAPVIAAAAAIVAVATAATVYAATRPAHTVQGAPVAAAPSTPSGTPAAPPSSVPASSSLPASTSVPSTSATSTAPPGGSINGTWAGTYVSGVVPAAKGDFTVTFSVDGSAVTGTITIASGCIHDGTISGTLTGPSLNFGKVKSTDDVGSVTFQATVSGDHMSGQYETNAACGSDLGTWEASRS